MSIPANYVEKVYAGVLGKIIGVYLGRPFEGWLYERIQKELGEINYYVHEQCGVPLIVTDDDISGTFTFLRALPDYENDPDITPGQIGQTWLNYLIEERTVLWWGGMGNSTEHTAYLRLKEGYKAPESGSIELNGKVVAEQIGAQIFIDGWAMVSPGDPERAADLARRAASVSHDGEAIYGAQVLAAMEALAFIENDRNKLLDVGVSFIPKDSVIYRMVGDLREWNQEINDWRKARQLLEKNYGYDRYGGNCHMVPNHGLIILGLLYGKDDFQKTLMITNTCGWDTDCNSGNIGCLMGIKNGLEGIDAGPDWRGPVADQLYLPTADGGRCVSDAVTETYHIVNIGRSLEGLPSITPKNGARFHFCLPGSVQGFRVIETPETQGLLRLSNPADSPEQYQGLRLIYQDIAPSKVVRAATPVFMPPEAMKMPGYSLYASPLVYPGQTVKANLTALPDNDGEVSSCLYFQYYGPDDKLIQVEGPAVKLNPGKSTSLLLKINDLGGAPVAQIGIQLTSEKPANGCVVLKALWWDGQPDVTLSRPEWPGTAWTKAWVKGVDYLHSFVEPYRLIQNTGVGLLIQGTREWQDYHVSADITPHMVDEAGLAVNVQGMRRYYAFVLSKSNKVRLLKCLDTEVLLSETDFSVNFGETYQMSMSTKDGHLKTWINGQLIFDLLDDEKPFLTGAIGLLCRKGRTATQSVVVKPLT